MSALTDWVRISGEKLPPVSVWDSVEPDRLARFDGALGGADAVFLGEFDHFIHEKTDFRLLMTRWLVSRGIARLAEEMSWSDGTRVDRYLRSGDDLQLRRLTGLGYTGDLRTDRSDRPTGILKASFDAYPVDLFAAEQLRFYRGLRALGGITDFFGLDIDALPGGAYADITDAVAHLAPDPARVAWLAGLKRVPGESVAEEAARTRRVLEGYKDAVAHLGSREVMARVGVSLVTLVHSLEYIAETYAQTTYEGLSVGLALRERVMKDKAWEAVNHLGEVGRVAFMGHAMHLMKDDALGDPVGATGPGGGVEPSLGHWLAKDNPMKVFSVWLVFGGGADSQPFPDLPQRFNFPAQTLNAALAEFTTPVLFPIAGAPPGLFERRWMIGHMYNATFTTVLAGQVDAILYLPRVSPMRAG